MDDQGSKTSNSHAVTPSRVFTGVASAECLLLGIAYAYFVPHFKTISDDRGTHLPPLVRVVVSIPAAGYLAAGLLFGAVVFLKSRWLHARTCLWIDWVVVIGGGVSFPIVMMLLAPSD